jgi:hypothetical protein
MLGLLGALGLAAAAYFTFFAAPEDGGVVSAGDWLVAAWAIAMAVGYLVVSFAMRPGRPRVHRAAIALVLSHLAFGAVKVFGYGETETEGFTFYALDLVVLALLLLLRTPARPERG